jgi:hypothetical protein
VKSTGIAKLPLLAVVSPKARGGVLVLASPRPGNVLPTDSDTRRGRAFRLRTLNRRRGRGIPVSAEVSTGPDIPVVDPVCQSDPDLVALASSVLTQPALESSSCGR